MWRFFFLIFMDKVFFFFIRYLELLCIMSELFVFFCFCFVIGLGGVFGLVMVEYIGFDELGFLGGLFWGLGNLFWYILVKFDFLELFCLLLFFSLVFFLFVLIFCFVGGGVLILNIGYVFWIEGELCWVDGLLVFVWFFWGGGVGVWLFFFNRIGEL